MKSLPALTARPPPRSLPVRGAWIEIIPSWSWGTRYTGRSPYGERGLKFRKHHQALDECASLPVRGAWIEIIIFCTLSNSSLSLPVRGAWIEIEGSFTTATGAGGRSPYGERGLKYLQVQLGRGGDPSLPVRGAWIEIGSSGTSGRSGGSLPVRGAWIEISYSPFHRCREAVAPRTGSVD